MWLAAKLIEFRIYENSVTESFCQLLVDEDLAANVRLFIFAHFVKKYPDHRFQELVPVFRTIFESDDLCDSLTTPRGLFSDQIAMLDDTIFQTMGDRSAVRTQLLMHLQEKARYAASALTWLDELGKGQSELAELARETAEKIRQKAPWF